MYIYKWLYQIIYGKIDLPVHIPSLDVNVLRTSDKCKG